MYAKTSRIKSIGQRTSRYSRLRAKFNMSTSVMPADGAGVGASRDLPKAGVATAKAMQNAANTYRPERASDR